MVSETLTWENVQLFFVQRTSIFLQLYKEILLFEAFITLASFGGVDKKRGSRLITSASLGGIDDYCGSKFGFLKTRIKMERHLFRIQEHH